MNNKTTYLVTPTGVKICANTNAAIAHARSINSYVASQTGGRGGADCYVVTGSGNDLAFRGLVLGRRLVGENFSCADNVLRRVREANEA